MTKLNRWPLQAAEQTVVEVHRRASASVVDEIVIVEGRNQRSTQLTGDEIHRELCRRPGIDPSAKVHHQDRIRYRRPGVNGVHLTLP